MVLLLHKQQLYMQQIFNFQDFYNLLTGRTPQMFHQSLMINFKKNGINISKEQWSILAVLWEQDGCSQQLLADRSFRDRASVTRLIDNMEKDQLVERHPDPDDRRSKLIFLTPKGKNMQETIIPLVRKTVLESIKGISDKEIISLRDTLKKVYQNLKSSNE